MPRSRVRLAEAFFPSPSLSLYLSQERNAWRKQADVAFMQRGWLLNVIGAITAFLFRSACNVLTLQRGGFARTEPGTRGSQVPKSKHSGSANRRVSSLLPLHPLTGEPAVSLPSASDITFGYVTRGSITMRV